MVLIHNQLTANDRCPPKAKVTLWVITHGPRPAWAGGEPPFSAFVEGLADYCTQRGWSVECENLDEDGTNPTNPPTSVAIFAESCPLPTPLTKDGAECP